MSKPGPPKGTPKPAGSGRKPGSLNKATLLRVEEYFCEREMHPVTEIMKLIPQMRPDAAAHVLLELLKYIQPQLKQAEVAIPPSATVSEENPASERTTEALLSLATT
jgi:hypothetical protein